MAGDTDDEMPLATIDTPSPSSSKQPPIPDEPIDFGNIPEIKVLTAQSAPKVPSLTSLLQAVVDSGQLKQLPTSVIADSGAPLKLPSQAMDIGPGERLPTAFLLFSMLNLFQISHLLTPLSLLPRALLAPPLYVSLTIWYLGWILALLYIRKPLLSLTNRCYLLTPLPHLIAVRQSLFDIKSLPDLLYF